MFALQVCLGEHVMMDVSSNGGERDIDVLGSAIKHCLEEQLLAMSVCFLRLIW